VRGFAGKVAAEELPEQGFAKNTGRGTENHGIKGRAKAPPSRSQRDHTSATSLTGPQRLNPCTAVPMTFTLAIAAQAAQRC